MKIHSISTVLLVFGLSATLHGLDLQPLLTVPGKVHYTEEFSSAKMSASFVVSDGHYTFKEGAVVIEPRSGRTRSMFAVMPVLRRDFTMSFAVKITNPGSLYFSVVGYKKKVRGVAGLVRFGITPGRLVWDDPHDGIELDTLESADKRAARLEKHPAKELAGKDVQNIADEWHQVMIEVSGTELVAQMDGEKLFATSIEVDTTKNRIGGEIVGNATVLIKELSISENTRRPDWQQVKAKLDADARVKR